MNEYAWWRWLCGWVRFETDGDAAGRLLALAARDGVALWDTRREGDSFSACCRAAEYPRLRPVARRVGRRLHVTERHGAAFVLRRYHARLGLPLGLAAFLIVLTLLSARIWAIDIRGLQYADEAQLRALLAEHGVTVGAVKRTVDSEAIRLDALTRLTDVSWVAVNLDGCVAEVELREMNPYETPDEPTAPSNLVAARDGVVVAVEITGGAATVKVGDAVATGGLLASGVTSNDIGTTFHRSSGRVIAKTARTIAVEIPLAELCALPSGPPTETLTLRFFGWEWPLFDNAVSSEGCRVEVCDRTPVIGDITLPLGMRMERYTPLAVQTLTRTEAEAETLAQAALREKEAALLSDATVLTRSVTAETVNGVFVITAEYTCLENIALEVPLRFD